MTYCIFYRKHLSNYEYYLLTMYLIRMVYRICFLEKQYRQLRADGSSQYYTIRTVLVSIFYSFLSFHVQEFIYCTHFFFNFILTDAQGEMQSSYRKLERLVDLVDVQSFKCLYWKQWFSIQYMDRFIVTCFVYGFEVASVLPSTAMLYNV